MMRTLGWLLLLLAMVANAVAAPRITEDFDDICALSD